MNTFSKITLGCFAAFSCVFSEGNANFGKSVSQDRFLSEIGQKKESDVKKIVLYINATCPFCKKVLHALDEIDKSVQIKDISTDDNLREELVDIGGKKQVPCIVINGNPKYESSEIIQWLIDNQDSL